MSENCELCGKPDSYCPECDTCFDCLDKEHEAVVIQLAMIDESIVTLKKIHPPKFKHECLEWDGMVIDEYDPEFHVCSCFDDQH